MPKPNETPTKFRPERPICLNEENTGFRTKDEVLHAIEQLRDKGWLCTYGEKARPFHMSFNDEREFAEFKKTCNDLNVKLKNPVLKSDELDELEAEALIVKPEPHRTYEDTKGKVHIE